MEQAAERRNTRVRRELELIPGFMIRLLVNRFVVKHLRGSKLVLCHLATEDRN